MPRYTTPATAAYLVATLAAACTGSDVPVDRADTAAAQASPASASADGRARAPRDTLWLLAPDPSNDAVRAADTEATLAARYGAANVQRALIDQGEGMLVPGTVLFPADSLRRLHVQWDDTIAMSRPVQVVVAGRAGRWLVAPGIGMGTPLTDLERMNGAPFELGGFGGHHPGVVTGWGGGRLAVLDQVGEQSSWRRAIIRLRPDEPYPAGVDADRYDTESMFLSSDAGMQQLQPRVSYIAVHPR